MTSSTGRDGRTIHASVFTQHHANSSGNRASVYVDRAHACDGDHGDSGDSDFFASTTLLNRAKTRKTEFTLKIVNDALEAFRREAPSIIRAGKGRYLNRYGKYPPDELEPFTASGIPGCTSSCRSLIPGGAAVMPKPSSGGYPAMLFYTSAQPEFEHRDIAAMVLGIRVFGDQSNAILTDIPEGHWVDGPVDNAGVPLQYLDRDNDGMWDPTKGDEQIRYIVDAWRVPLGYFS